jgi:hypothetical protein
MFINVDPPHELFMDKNKMKPGENVGQAAGKFGEAFRTSAFC